MPKPKKKSKVKGYGAYWAGDIKNKHIARKNDQYIRDQKYLHRYKKTKASLETEGVPEEPRNSSDHDVAAPAHSDVPVVRPEVETNYLIQSDDDSLCGFPESQLSDIAEHRESDTANQPKSNRGDVYSKALKMRREAEKEKLREYNERVEQIKKRKKEIREKKQQRYERHRLLGAKTKKGQPIMKNVIKHIMRKFTPGT